MQEVNKQAQNFGLAPEPIMPEQETTNILDITEYKQTDLPHLHISRSDIVAYCLKCEKKV
jgi:hypothetical protein